jgi:hypothetical protein
MNKPIQVIHPDGSIHTEYLPAEMQGALSKMQSLVGGYVEPIRLSATEYLIVHENEKINGKPHRANFVATQMAKNANAIIGDDYIAGVALLVPAEYLN